MHFAGTDSLLTETMAQVDFEEVARVSRLRQECSLTRGVVLAQVLEAVDLRTD
jgi:hypothetical protein